SANVHGAGARVGDHQRRPEYRDADRLAQSVGDRDRVPGADIDLRARCDRRAARNRSNSQTRIERPGETAPAGTHQRITSMLRTKTRALGKLLGQLIGARRRMSRTRRSTSRMYDQAAVAARPDLAAGRLEHARHAARSAEIVIRPRRAVVAERVVL